MARAKYQVLVIPYRIDDNGVSYCIFKRSDMVDCWQFIAGGGEDEDASPLVSAKREAWEEAGIPMDLHAVQLETMCSISTEDFKNARLIWGNNCLVIPEYCYAVRLEEPDIQLSHEHESFAWVDYATAKQNLRYDSNKVALWELDSKIKLGILP